ncbi:uncharacterized protein LOC141648523 [Silene latifolia]|uniref:uncharacterized protein LOC141648523 n=1 Tax=Silene latifolia TaxID=37657 RepID=UPI003D76A7E3
MVGYEPDLNLPDFDDEEFSLMLPASNPVPSSWITPSLRPDIESEDNDNYEAEDLGFDGRLATPLVQVFSVRVSTNFDDGKPCEIHGSIRVLEGSDCQFHLYDRHTEDSETIYQSGNLSLIGPHDGAILPSMRTKLKFELKDKIRGVDVVNGKLKLDLSTEDSYDRLLKGTVKGAHGSASVYYVVFRFACYGYVQVRVTKIDNDENKCNTADMYGSVVARYENARMYCSDEKDVKLLETRLFDHPSCLPLRLLDGTNIRMSRNVVVVPTYSTLAIEVNLWDLNGEIASDRLQFPAYLQSEVPLYIQTQYARVQVQIIWGDAYLYPDTVERRPRELHNQHLLANLVPAPLPRTKQYSGFLKAEVFTVFIGGINEKVSGLCGTILVEDGSLDKVSIYNRDESCSELLRDHSLACIEVNYRAIQNSDFYIILNLTDPDGKLEVSKGCISFHLGYIDLKMYERRVCSVVPGKVGYAAVHYEVFDNAFEALVDVKLFAANGELDIPTSLYGTLLACYSGHNYSTSYEKKYYKSRLIDCPPDKAVESKTGSKIALLKSIVVVPARSTLIIEANLSALGINNVIEPIHGKVEFEINKHDTISKKIRGQDYGIEIDVKFKN